MTLGGLLRPLLRKRIVQACARAFDGETIVEVGVYRGKSARWIQEAAPDSPLYLCDTFTGIPRVCPADNYHRQGDFGNTSDSLVRMRVPEAIVIAGDITEINLRNLHLPFAAFVHCDVDVYEATKAVLDAWPNAVILVDDYGTSTCKGAKQAVDESLRPVIAFPTEQALVLP